MHTASLAALTAASVAAFAAHTAQAQSMYLKAPPLAQTQGAFVSLDAPAQAAQAASAFSDADLVAAKSPMPKVKFLPASAFDYNAAAAEAQNTSVAFDKPGKRPVADAQALVQRREISAAALALLPAGEVVPEATEYAT